MAELLSKEVDLREATIALLQHLGIQSGLWNLTVKLGFGTVTLGDPQTNTPVPAAIVTIAKLGLQETALNAINVSTVDAANPERAVSREEEMKKSP